MVAKLTVFAFSSKKKSGQTCIATFFRRQSVVQQVVVKLNPSQTHIYRHPSVVPSLTSGTQLKPKIFRSCDVAEVMPSFHGGF